MYVKSTQLKGHLVIINGASEGYTGAMKGFLAEFGDELPEHLAKHKKSEAKNDNFEQD